MSEIAGRDGMARLQVDISDEIKSALRVYAAQHDTTQSDVVETALKEFFERREKKGK